MWFGNAAKATIPPAVAPGQPSNMDLTLPRIDGSELLRMPLVTRLTVQMISAPPLGVDISVVFSDGELMRTLVLGAVVSGATVLTRESIALPWTRTILVRFSNLDPTASAVVMWQLEYER